MSRSRTQRPVHPGHAEPEVVLPEGLEAGPTGVSPWGAPCPPLQGTVQAPRTGGPIWKGSRGGAGSGPSQRQPCPGRLPHPRAAGLALAIVLGERNQEDKQSETYRNFPAPPTPQGPLPSGSQSSGRKLTLADRQTNSPGQGRSASTSCLWSRGAHSRPLARRGAPGGWGAQGSLWLRSSQGCWRPTSPRTATLPS